MADYTIVTVDTSNVDDHGFFCVKNRKHAGYVAKRSWLERRFEQGLRIKLIETADGRPAGFLEYAPAEQSWRAVDAPSHLLIHCLWVASNKFPYTGMASDLLTECAREARTDGKAGVAVVSSDGPWMAARDIYLKNGFEPVDEAEPHFQLLAKRLKPGPTPAFPVDWDDRLQRLGSGLRLVYTNQCPYIGKAVAELPPVAKRYGIRLQLVELDDPAEARAIMPTPYGVICLAHNGRLLADHPISATRFKNILEKDLKLVPKRGK